MSAKPAPRASTSTRAGHAHRAPRHASGPASVFPDLGVPTAKGKATDGVVNRGGSQSVSCRVVAAADCHPVTLEVAPRQ
eukprot:8344188-Alexandrium_andersonii.AAC.1